MSSCNLYGYAEVTKGHIIRPTQYSLEELARFLTENVVATMPEVQSVLGTRVYKTALRKLKQLSYLSSYSHGGRYYTLRRFARFSERGLWCYDDIHFSKHGTLMSTLRRFISIAEDGYFADELEELLSVGVKVSLLRLINDGTVSREKVANRYLYCSADADIRNQQIWARNLMGAAQQEFSDAARAAIVIFLSTLNEKERRLYAGVEAIKYGYGGDQWISNLLGIHPQTVARGRKELLSGQVDVARTRKTGGGRKTLEKKHRRSSKKLKS